MFTEPHTDRDDKKVWLSAEEVDELLAAADGPTQRLAYQLGVRCGLRSEEVTDVTPQDVRDQDGGPILLVQEGKGDKYRETPIPPSVAQHIEIAAEQRPEPDDYPIVTSQSSTKGVSTRTLRRWIEATGDELGEDGDPRWSELTFHDLRRTWATQLKGQDVDALLVCDWGGWDDLETFLEHYRGTYAPDVQKRERRKVEWLN